MISENIGIIEPEQLLKHLNDPRIIVLDGSMKKTVSGQNENYGNRFIKGAYQLDFENDFCDPSNDLPHTMPTAEKFTLATQDLGISANDNLVIYDDKGIYSSPRIWWMFKSMGHNKVWVLNGGLPRWEELGYPIQSKSQSPSRKGDFLANYQNDCFHSADNVVFAIDDDKVQLIDVRSPSRFSGREPEPRVGLRSGHIPSAINIPCKRVMNGSQYLEHSELSKLFSQLIPSQDHKLVFNCGSGVTSCVVALAAFQCGYVNLSVYDGSWTEWGARKDLPIEST